MNEEYAFFVPPKYVGYWQIGGTLGVRIAQVKKPRWLTRFICNLLMEWEWEDA